MLWQGLVKPWHSLEEEPWDGYERFIQNIAHGHQLMKAERCDEDLAASVVCSGVTSSNTTCTYSSQYFCMTVREPVNELQKQMNGNEVSFGSHKISYSVYHPEFCCTGCAREGEDVLTLQQACFGHFTLFKNISKGPLSVQ